MQTGTIEHLTDKGFGFIKVEGYDKNIFFHAKDLMQVSFDELQKGDTVSVEEIMNAEKGYAGKGIKLIS